MAVLATLAGAIITAPTGAGANGDPQGKTDKRPCATGCRVDLNASPNVRHWTSPHLLWSDLRVNVVFYGRKLTPTYYKRNGELCVGYYSGYGATVKVNVCGDPYRLRATTQAFRGPKKSLQIQYKASYRNPGSRALIADAPPGAHRFRAFKH
jgi:hypothetical protein